MTQEALDDRLTETDEALAGLSQRVDELATGVESATASLGGQGARARSAPPALHGVELAHRDDRRRHPRGARCVPGHGSRTRSPRSPRGSTDVGGRDRSGESGRSARGRSRRRPPSAELAERIDALDGRVAAVAAEIARAKTLWPVALRSLEARLDDVAPPRTARRRDRRRRPSRRPRTSTRTTPTTFSPGFATACRRWRTSPRRWSASQDVGDRATPSRDSRGHPAGDGRRSARRPATRERTRRHTIMLRPLDTLLLALGRHGRGRAAGWSTGRSPCSRCPSGGTAPLSRLTHPPGSTP